jgi:AcrR family transcriptional regulator
MTEAALTPDRILDAAEDVLRRFGPQKTAVVDVARALDVSHGTIYRHFPSKQALRDAVTRRWLHRVALPLRAIAGEGGPATVRLRGWLDALRATKRQKVLDDPEMFATYHALAEEAREVVRRHVEELVEQLAQVIRDGMADGEFRRVDPEIAARAVFDATARFHHPAHAAEWSDPAIDAAFEGVWRLVLDGLSAAGPRNDKRSRRLSRPT